MTKREAKAEVIDLKGLLTQDEDFVRAAVEALVQAALEAEMTEVISAAKGERSETRLAYRSGHYTRRYPFLWNSPVQDKTQWPGFADNRNDILGLSRNLGEVYGVFAVFRPKKDRWHLLGVDYLNENSANFRGLNALEGLVKKIGPPKWPFAIDAVLAKQGEAIYGWPKEQGGCTECHGIRPGVTRFFEQKTRATPIQDVGTDTREYNILSWTAQSGVCAVRRFRSLSRRSNPATSPSTSSDYQLSDQSCRNMSRSPRARRKPARDRHSGSHRRPQISKARSFPRLLPALMNPECSTVSGRRPRTCTMARFRHWPTCSN